MSFVEREYRRLVDEMTPAQRFQRAAEMLDWARGVIARRIVAEQGPMPPERLRWEVALRQYGHEPQARMLIERMLEHVSR